MSSAAFSAMVSIPPSSRLIRAMLGLPLSAVAHGIYAKALIGVPIATGQKTTVTVLNRATCPYEPLLAADGTRSD